MKEEMTGEELFWWLDNFYNNKKHVMSKHCVVVFDAETYELKGVYKLKTFNYQFEINKEDKEAFDAYHYVTVISKQTRIEYRACLELVQ